MRNKFIKNRCNENWQAYRKQRNKCTSLNRQAKKAHFKCFTEEAGVASKDFYSVAGIHIGNKTRSRNENYMLLENEEIIRDESKISEIFNDYFVNIVERTTSKNEGYTENYDR